MHIPVVLNVLVFSNIMLFEVQHLVAAHNCTFLKNFLGRFIILKVFFFLSTDSLKDWYYTKSKEKFCNLSVMILSVWWIWKLKLKNGKNEMVKDKFVNVKEIKCEDPFFAEWYWNLYWWLACDMLMEMWNMK